MYTDSVEKEMAFLSSLWSSHNIKMTDGETVDVVECPKCHKGRVQTCCVSKIDNAGIRSWRFDHCCENCGEIFNLVRIEADIFFHKAYKIAEKLETPFGDIEIKINGKSVPFRYRTEQYVAPGDPSGSTVKMHVIDIDLSKYKPGDEIFCGFEKNILEYNSSDEHSVLCSCEDEEQILGFCAYEPYEEDLEYCCFQLQNYSLNGFEYQVVFEPRQYNKKENYRSKIISLAVSWLNKSEYVNADLVTFQALTYVIG